MKMYAPLLVFLAALVRRGSGESSSLVEAENFLASFGNNAAPTANLGQVSLTLAQVVATLAAEEKTAVALSTARKNDCRTKAMALKKSISKSTRGAAQADADLKVTKAGTTEVKANIKKVKLSISATHTELSSLTKKLKKLRDDFKKKKVTSKKSLSQIDQAVVTLSARTDNTNSAEHKEVNGLRMLTGILEANQQSQQDANAAPAPQADAARASEDDDDDSASEVDDDSASEHDDDSAPEVSASDDDDSAPEAPVSFLQARQVPKAALVVLENDRAGVVSYSEGADDAFRKEEKRLLLLTRKQEKRLAALQNNLAGLQPSLAEKMDSLAEGSRKQSGLKLSLARDTKLLGGLKNKCKFYMTSGKEQKKLRDAAQTRLKMAIAMFKAASKGAAAIQTDVHDMNDLEGGALAFLQVGEGEDSEDWSTEFTALSSAGGASGASAADAGVAASTPDASGVSAADLAALQGGQPVALAAPQEEPRPSAALLSEAAAERATAEDAEDAAAANSGDPFKMVKGLIKGLITKLKAEHNKDATQQEFCSKGKAQIRTQKQAKKDLFDQKTAEVRLQKASILKLTADVSWLTGEVARLKKMTLQNKKEIADETKRKTTIDKDHKLAQDIVAKVIIIAGQLCGTSFLQGAQEAVVSADSKGAQCTQAIKMAKESITMIKAMDTSNHALFGKFQVILKKVIAEGKKATADKTRELTQAKSGKATRAESLRSAKTDLKNAALALKKSDTAMAEMKKSCSPAVESYGARAKRRQTEINALKDALQVLRGEAVPISGAALNQLGGGMARLDSVRQMFQSGPLAGLQDQAGALLGF